MKEGIPDQRQFWDAQHTESEDEFTELESRPNLFAEHCLPLIPDDGKVLELGAANGRDARFFAREKHCEVVALDFSSVALKQLEAAARRDGTTNLIHPVIAQSEHFPIAADHAFDAFYSRSSLHLSDNDLDRFFRELLPSLKETGYLMVQGKPADDPRITRGIEISPHLIMNDDGHLRRVWDEEYIQREIIKNSDCA